VPVPLRPEPVLSALLEGGSVQGQQYGLEVAHEGRELF
jgi:hypothetical protein